MAGIVAAAATAGAEMAFGWRLGDALAPFAATGWQLAASQPAALAVMLGVLAHIATAVVWGVVFGVVAPRRGVTLVVIVSLLVTAAAALVHTFALPTFRLGAGLGGPRAPVGPVVALYLVFAAALVVGMLAAPREDRLSRAG